MKIGIKDLRLIWCTSSFQAYTPINVQLKISKRTPIATTSYVIMEAGATKNPSLMEDGGCIPENNDCQETIPLDQKEPLNQQGKRRTHKKEVIILIGCFINHFIILGLNKSLGVIYVELIREFHAHRSEAALVQSVNLGTMLAAGIMFINTVERFGPGLCSLVGMSVATVSVFISVFSTSIFMVIAFAGFTAGLGIGVTFFANFMAINGTFKAKKRVAMAILTVATPLSQFSFQYITEYLLERYYWSGTFLILSGVLLNSIPCNLIIHFNYSVSKKDNVEMTKLNDKASSTIEVLKNSAVIFVFILMMIVNIGIITQSLFTVDLAEFRGYNRNEGAVLYSLIGLGSFIGRFSGVLLLAILVNVDATIHYIYGLAMYGVAHFVVIYFTQYATMLVGIILQGYFCGLLASTFPGLMIELCGAGIFPKVLALSNVIDGVVYIVGVFLGSYLADVTGGYGMLYYIAVGCAEFGAVMIIVRLKVLSNKERLGLRRSDENVCVVQLKI